MYTDIWKKKNNFIYLKKKLTHTEWSVYSVIRENEKYYIFKLNT